MKAIVKRPYFDNSGLHKVGDVVEVDKASDLVDVIAEETKAKPKAEEKPEPKAEPKKPTTKAKSTSKKKG